MNLTNPYDKSPLDEAWDEGYSAGMVAIDEANPYEALKHPNLHDTWQAAYDAALRIENGEGGA